MTTLDSNSQTAPKLHSESARPPGLRRTLVRSAVQVWISTVASQASGLVRTYVAAKLLGPAVYGLWLGLRLIVDYGINLHFGAIYGMHRNVPLLRGRGDNAGAELAKRTTLSFVLLCGLIFAPLLPPLIVRLYFPGTSTSLLWGISAVLFIQLVRGHYAAQFKADNRFAEASVATLVGSVAALSTIPLIWIWGLAGFVWGQFALIFAEAAYLMVCDGWPRLRLDFSVLRGLLAIGVPTMFIVSASVLLTSIDRTVILAKLDATRLGHYGVAFLAMTFLNGLAAAPNAVLYPRLSERFGKTGLPSDLVQLVRDPLRLMGVLFAVVIGASALATPALVHYLLPKYEPGVLAAQISMFGVYSYVVVGAAANCFFALNWQKLYLAILLMASGIGYALTLVAVHLSPGLPAVAAGVSAGLLIYLILTVLGAFWIMERPLLEGLSTLALSLGPIVLIAALTISIQRWLPLLIEGQIRNGVVGEALLLILTGPWIYGALRRAFAIRAGRL